MSRTFKRPMFRIGGNVGTGIMSGIVDRSKHADNPWVGKERFDYPFKGEDEFVPKYSDDIVQEKVVETENPYGGDSISVEDAVAQLKEGAGEYGGMDPLTAFLLRAGPSIATAKNFSDVVAKLDPATKGLIEDKAAQAKYDRGIRLAGVKRALGQQDIMEGKKRDWEAKVLGREDTQAHEMFKQSEYFKQLDKNKQELWAREDNKLIKLWDRQDKLLLDQKTYNAMLLEDKKAYDAELLEQANKRADLKEEERKIYDQKLIDDGREWELEKMDKLHELAKERIDYTKDSDATWTTAYFMEKYDDNSEEATNRARYENEKIPSQIKEKFGNKMFGGLIGGEQHGALSAFEKKANLGKVYYDVTDDKIKQLRKTKDGWGWKEIDIETYEAPEVIEGDKGVISEMSASKVVLSQSDAEKEAANRGLILIPEPPAGNKQKMYYKIQRDKLGENAVSLRELQEMIRQELFKEKYKNVKPQRRN